MNKKEFYAKLKYKNTAFGLACSLLIILGIGSACNIKPKKPQPEPSSSESQQEEEPKEEENAIPDKNTYTRGKLATDFKYVDVRSDSQLHSGLLVPYTFEVEYKGERPKDLVSIYEYLFSENKTQIINARSTQIYLTKETAEHFNALARDFKGQTGLATLMISDGYVPESDDVKNNEYWDPSYTKAAKCEEHFLGTSIDLLTYPGDGSFPEFTGEDKYAWVLENMSHYGFILRYPEGKEDVTGHEAFKNHIRYVGYPDSQIMYDNNFTLEEYIEEIKKYDYKNQYILTDTHGGKYCVYYVPADKSKTTNVPIPIDGDKELKYRISGDAKEGFIVSCMVEQPQ
ncbi:MAG: D-alanyl-D-alanine carboxypeptidase family protein [Ruminococcus sp.]|nr:D-alanyl-D-alanine carboxypeptidase family protein [Ruminococcus sp.]